MSPGIEQPANREPIRFCLYVVEGAPNSIRALANFRHLAEKYLSNYQLEIVDVTADPLRALRANALVTPMLVRQTPPVLTIVGSLDDTKAILSALGIETESS